MNQCVPSWDIDENSAVPKLDYEVAELTWKNGQLAMHGLGLPRTANNNKPALTSSPTKYPTNWDKPCVGGTLESIVNQATTRLPKSAAEDLVPWFDHRHVMVNPSGSTSMNGLTMDALVPTNNSDSNRKSVNQDSSTNVIQSVPVMGGGSTPVGSCSGTALDRGPVRGGNRNVGRRVEMNSFETNGSTASESATFGGDSSRQVTNLDTCDLELGGAAGFMTSPSMGYSPENTNSTGDCTKSTDEDHDSIHMRKLIRPTVEEKGKKRGTGKSSISTKRSRAAAIHNQSERKRRDKINQKMKTLQKLVPNSSKTDKASMLDEVIDYLKQLQAQVHMMKMNMSPMMLPIAMQQQIQMSMMAPMGMGMGMGMDMNAIGRCTPGMQGGIQPPGFFMPMAAWDNIPGDRLSTPATAGQDPLSAFLACQSQRMTMDAYNRMAAMYQQFQQPGPGSKN